MILATVLFGKLLKIWVVIRGDAILLLFLDCSAKLVVLCNASFSHQVKFYSFGVYVNGGTCPEPPGTNRNPPEPTRNPPETPGTYPEP